MSRSTTSSLRRAGIFASPATCTRRRLRRPTSLRRCVRWMPRATAGGNDRRGDGGRPPRRPELRPRGSDRLPRLPLDALARTEAAARVVAGGTAQPGRAGVRRGYGRRARQRPDAAALRRAPRRADHRHRPSAGRGRAAVAGRARRDLAGERRRPVPARGRPASRAPRSELLRCRALPHRRRRALSLRHGQAGRVPVGQSRERVAPRAHPLLHLRPAVHAAARDADVLPGRSALRVRPDLPRGARPEVSRALDRALRSRHDAAGVGARLPVGHRPRSWRSAHDAGGNVMRPRTPSQTVGPFYAIGLCRRPENELVPPDDPGAVELTGQLLDGEELPVSDGLIELWDAGARRWGRCGTDAGGRFSFVVSPAQHYEVFVFARGLLRHQLTRVYFADAEENGALRFDIRLQGDRETVFFAH